MKKLIRIILILLLIHFVAEACSESADCTGPPADGFVCIINSENNNCNEKEKWSRTGHCPAD